MCAVSPSLIISPVDSASSPSQEEPSAPDDKEHLKEFPHLLMAWPDHKGPSREDPENCFKQPAYECSDWSSRCEEKGTIPFCCLSDICMVGKAVYKVSRIKCIREDTENNNYWILQGCEGDLGRILNLY